MAIVTLLLENIFNNKKKKKKKKKNDFETFPSGPNWITKTFFNVAVLISI